MSKQQKEPNVRSHYIALVIGAGFVGWRLTKASEFQSLDYLALAVGIGVVLSAIYSINKARNKK